MSYYTFILHAGRHLGMLKWLVNCFLKAIVKFLDWQRMQEWKLVFMPMELKTLCRGGPGKFLGKQMLE